MGSIKTLLEVIKNLDSFAKEDTIYACKPWNENSNALVLSESAAENFADELKKLNMVYFLEVFIAQDFIEDWVENLTTERTDNQKCERLIEYAINDV